LRILDFRFWIDSTDKSGGLYHEEIFGHFQALLEQCNAAVEPLPWNQLDVPPNQLNLW
jgi:hypothetical protein